MYKTITAVIYTILVGGLVALFVGFGIQAFYPSPKFPEYPHELEFAKGDPSEYTDAQKVVKDEYDKKSDDYKNKQKEWSKNASVIAISAGLILLIVSLTVLQPVPLISNGFLLGSGFTLIYGTGTSFMSEDSKFQFAMIAVTLVVAIVLGYLKFVKPEKVK
ncbi:MAG: hypothetical protein WCT32_02760 [Patescibacteria group bacterium]|jgi:hypothetical protein